MRKEIAPLPKSPAKALNRKPDATSVLMPRSSASYRPTLVQVRSPIQARFGHDFSRLILNAEAASSLESITGSTSMQRQAETSAPIQRTVDTAAEALFKQGVIKVKKNDIKGRFAKDHEISPSDLDAIQTQLDVLRASKPASKKATVADVSVPANRPTTGGMTEGDATTLADLNGWTQSSEDWQCSDRSHTPKGKVYTDGASYYGADNTGHVGWGFKVWTVKKKGVLDYAGNTVWNGTGWDYVSRGT